MKNILWYRICFIVSRRITNALSTQEEQTNDTLNDNINGNQYESLEGRFEHLDGEG